MRFLLATLLLGSLISAPAPTHALPAPHNTGSYRAGSYGAGSDGMTAMNPIRKPNARLASLFAELTERLYPELSNSGCECSSTGTSEVDFFLVEDQRVNAFSYSGDASRNLPPKIVISTALVSKVDSAAELAFVIAHELAHIYLDLFPADTQQFVFSGAVQAHIKRTHQLWEVRADAEAASRMSRAGFDSRAGAEFLAKRMTEHEHSTSADSSHPMVAERAERLRAVTYMPESGAGEQLLSSASLLEMEFRYVR